APRRRRELRLRPERAEPRHGTWAAARQADRGLRQAAFGRPQPLLRMAWDGPLRDHQRALRPTRLRLARSGGRKALPGGRGSDESSTRDVQLKLSRGKTKKGLTSLG